MKAAQHQTYHKNKIELAIVDIPIPKISAHEVRIKVLAAGVNPVDNMISKGEVKLIVPYKLPQTAGNEVVGLIEEVGSSVTGFAVGERVFARLPLKQIGAFAAYVAVDHSAIAKVPAYLSDVEAAAVPLTALTVMQAFDIMDVQKGETLFISGGTGGVGAMAIPLAKAKGLTVITNGSERNKERVVQLGVDQFIDYEKENYTEILQEIDYVLDTLGGDETEKQLSILKKGGKLVSLRAIPNGKFARRMQLPKWKQWLFELAGKKMDRLADRYGVSYDFVFVESNGKQLQEIAEILSQVEVQPSIDTVFSFEEVNSALQKIERGHSRGKTVITFSTKEASQ